jgi:hypothetical protein
MQHSRFNLVAQATVLLDKVLAQIRLNDKVLGLKDEMLQLERTIEALLEFTRVECSSRHLFRVFGCEVKAILYG